MPAAPAVSRSRASSPPPRASPLPVPRTLKRFDQSRCRAMRALSMRAYDSGVAYCVHSARGRQVMGGAETRTSFPFAWGSHRAKSVLSSKWERMIVPATSGFPFVPGLCASIVPSRVRTRGLIRSMCDGPRRHERQVPKRSFFASIPQLLYIETSQSCPLRTFGEPARRGPIESTREPASCWTRELSMPTDQMWLRTGLFVCARSGVASARARRIPMRRVIGLVLSELPLPVGSTEYLVLGLAYG